MSQYIISTIGLSKIYRMGEEIVTALKSVDLHIAKNEYVALMGPSGSGKSTLMNLIGCLDSPTAGEYHLNDINVSQMSDSDLAEVRNKEIGFVFQTFNLLPRMSALDNVAMPLVYAGKSKAYRDQKAQQVLEQVGLGDRMYHKPNELSGGQRQRVAIARALVNDPAIILADEPTGNLDSMNTGIVFDILQNLTKEFGQTIIAVTHDEDFARKSDRIIEMKDGYIIR